jgi:cell division protein FtsW (lipid II flippase)
MKIRIHAQRVHTYGGGVLLYSGSKESASTTIDKVKTNAYHHVIIIIIIIIIVIIIMYVTHFRAYSGIFLYVVGLCAWVLFVAVGRNFTAFCKVM